jgi:WD40 repeat protein
MAAVFADAADPVDACYRVLKGHSAVIMVACFSPDSQLIASGDDSGEIRIWEVATGACRHILDAHDGIVSALVFSADGRLISSSLDLRVWDLATGQCLRVIDGYDSGVTTIALSPNQQCLASASLDGTITLWDWSAWRYSDGPMTDRSNVETLGATVGEQGLPCLDTIQAVRPYEGLNISQVTGLTVAEQESLRRLGAVSS